MIAYRGNRTSGSRDTAAALNAHGGAHGRQDFESETFICEVAPTLDSSFHNAKGIDDQHINAGAGLFVEEKAPPLTKDAYADRASEEGLLIGFSGKDSGADAGEEVAPTMRAMPHDESHPNAGGQVAIAFNARQIPANYGNSIGALDQHGGSIAVATPKGYVRRITPTEAERLMGFPDGYTAVPFRDQVMKDGPRYRLLGNSIAVNVMAWIGQRIALFEKVTK